VRVIFGASCLRYFRQLRYATFVVQFSNAIVRLVADVSPWNSAAMLVELRPESELQFVGSTHLCSPSSSRPQHPSADAAAACWRRRSVKRSQSSLNTRVVATFYRIVSFRIVFLVTRTCVCFWLSVCSSVCLSVCFTAFNPAVSAQLTVVTSR